MVSRRNVLKQLGRGSLASALLMGVGIINSSSASAQENTSQIITRPNSRLEKKTANSPEYCYWYYDNPFSAPNKEKDQTWNTLQTPEQRKSYVLDKFAKDDTSKIPYVKDVWDCYEYSMRSLIHFFGFPESLNQSYNDFIYSKFKTSKENNAKFNIPLYHIGDFTSQGIGHAINAVLIGENPLNFNDWLFIEPQNDKEVKPGDWSMSKNGRIIITAPNDFNNNSINNFAIIDFQLDNGISIHNILEYPDILLTRPTQVSVASQTPSEFALKQNYPNPFNSSTAIKYNLSKPEKVSLEIYSLTGQRLETLVSETQSAGSHSIKWNAGNYASGNYFYQLRAGNKTESKKMIIVK